MAGRRDAAARAVERLPYAAIIEAVELPLTVSETAWSPVTVSYGMPGDLTYSRLCAFEPGGDSVWPENSCDP